MDNRELEKGVGALERIKELASNVGETLHVPSKNQILAVGAATVLALGASEKSQNSQAEARTPVDPEDNMAMVGTVTVKETVTKENGNKDTTVEVSRQRYDPFEGTSNRVPPGVYTAMGGSVKSSTTKQKSGRFLPLNVRYTLPDAYGCGIPAPSKNVFNYNPRKRYNLNKKNKPTYKKIFGKKSFLVKSEVATGYSTGSQERDQEIISTQGFSALQKSRKLKRLKVRPSNRSTARKFNINMDQCYPLAEATNPGNDKYRAAGYEYVPPVLVINYQGNISSKKKGVRYRSEVEGRFKLVDIRVYNQEQYKTAP